MNQPTPPRGDAPEKIWISGAPRKRRGSHWWMAHDYYSFKEQVPYIPEALAEERIAEALLSLDKKIADEVYLDEQEEENYAAGYEQAVDDCRMWIRAAAARSETK